MRVIQITHTRLIVLSFITAHAFPATVSASATIHSDFESDLEGWVASNTTATHVANGGNPGGYLFADNPESTITSLIAPAKFRGDLSIYNGGTFSFDGNLLQQTGPNYEPYGTVTISGSGGSASRDIVQGQPTAGQWLTHTGVLEASLWNKTQIQ